MHVSKSSHLLQMEQRTTTVENRIPAQQGNPCLHHFTTKPPGRTVALLLQERESTIKATFGKPNDVLDKSFHDWVLGRQPWLAATTLPLY